MKNLKSKIREFLNSEEGSVGVKRRWHSGSPQAGLCSHRHLLSHLMQMHVLVKMTVATTNSAAGRAWIGCRFQMEAFGHAA